MSREFLEMIKDELIHDHKVPYLLFEYLDDRIREIVDDRISHMEATLYEKLKEELDVPRS